MRRQELAVLAFKVLAVWVVLTSSYALVTTITSLYYFTEGHRLRDALTGLLGVGITVGVGLMVWLNADWFARHSFSSPPSDAGEAQGQISSTEIQGIAFAAIGVLVLTGSIPQLIFWIAMYAFSAIGSGSHSVFGPTGSPLTDQSSQIFDLKAKANIVSAVATTAIGIGLLFRSAVLVRLIQRVREAVLFPKETASEESGEKEGSDD